MKIRGIAGDGVGSKFWGIGGKRGKNDFLVAQNNSMWQHFCRDKYVGVGMAKNFGKIQKARKNFASHKLVKV